MSRIRRGASVWPMVTKIGAFRGLVSSLQVFEFRGLPWERRIALTTLACPGVGLRKVRYKPAQLRSQHS
jgi:hypothetical protein